MVPMSKRILLVSFDDRLLLKQRSVLEQQGYAVTSALHQKEAAVGCEGGSFDLLILGRSIPHGIKKDLIEIFQAHRSTPILSLWMQVLDTVNYVEFSGDLNKFVQGVERILAWTEERQGTGQPFEA
jgi:DNA-binding response OmpR family regulator